MIENLLKSYECFELKRNYFKIQRITNVGGSIVSLAYADPRIQLNYSTPYCRRTVSMYNKILLLECNFNDVDLTAPSQIGRKKSKLHLISNFFIIFL